MTPTFDPTPVIDSRFGASMGRADTSVEIGSDIGTNWHRFYDGPLTLVKVPLDDGGYDAGGAYWGLGETIWCAYSPPNEDVVRFWGPCGRAVVTYVRASSPAAAQKIVLDGCPNAYFEEISR